METVLNRAGMRNEVVRMILVIFFVGDADG